jgi:hypothetical protein
MEPSDHRWLGFRSHNGALKTVRQASLSGVITATAVVGLIRITSLRALHWLERKVSCIQPRRRDGWVYLVHSSTLHHLRSAIRIVAPSRSVRTISIQNTDSQPSTRAFCSEMPKVADIDACLDSVANKHLLTRFLRYKALKTIGPYDCFLVSNVILLRGGIFAADDSHIYSGFWKESIHSESWLAQRFCPPKCTSSDIPFLPGLSLA